MKPHAAADHAIVLGASLGGLLAARVLTDHFARVTLVERDELPVAAENRKGVPQGRHSHALLARGAEGLERFFPGLTQALAVAGVPSGDIGLSCRFMLGGRRLQTCTTGLRAVLVSRPLLEHHVRQRVRERAGGLQLLQRHVARRLHFAGSRVSGVHVAPMGEPESERLLEADLIVDATGRGSKTPEWLGANGFPKPEDESVHVGVSYATRLFRRQPTDAAGDLGIVIAAHPPNTRAGVAIVQEGGRWTVTLNGYFGERAPLDLNGFIEFARGLPSPDLYELIKAAEPLGDGVGANYPASVRRRFERLRRFPDRYLAFGDAICSFNPIFGQGMTVAVLQAELLEARLSEGLDRLAPRFFAGASRVIDGPWSIAVGNDLRFPQAVGARSLGGRLINRYLDHYVRAAASDPVLSRAFFEVSNLRAPPASLLRPLLACRAFFPARKGLALGAGADSPAALPTSSEKAFQ